MIVIENILGNRSDPAWSARLAGGNVDLLEVDQWEAQKSRFRKTTSKGMELALSLDRGTYIHDGDVLLWDAGTSLAVVARIDLRDVMAVRLEGLRHLPPDVMMRTCVEIGHALGNQHWPALVKGDVIYVPLTVDRKVMASVMATHRFENISYDFVPGRDVVPYLAPHESRRLFGGAEAAHTHEHAPEHAHPHHSHVLGSPVSANGHGKR